MAFVEEGKTTAADWAIVWKSDGEILEKNTPFGSFGQYRVCIFGTRQEARDAFKWFDLEPKQFAIVKLPKLPRYSFDLKQ